MRRSPFLVVVALVVLVVACGSGEGSESGKAEVRVTFDEPLRVGPVTWNVVVTNGTDDDLELTFPTGQRADISLRRGDEVVYQWSRAQLFTQIVSKIRIPAGGERAFTLDEPGLDVDPGSYTLTAVVSVSNRRDLRETRQVTVEAG